MKKHHKILDFSAFFAYNLIKYVDAESEVVKQSLAEQSRAEQSSRKTAVFAYRRSNHNRHNISKIQNHFLRNREDFAENGFFMHKKIYMYELEVAKWHKLQMS